jgi:hypothetical protein
VKKTKLKHKLKKNCAGYTVVEADGATKRSCNYLEVGLFDDSTT